MKVTKVDQTVSKHAVIVLCDAQTSGGLLISVSADKVDTLLNGLHGIGLADSAIVGEIVESGGFSLEILP
jgi:selenide,water dikinase